MSRVPSLVYSRISCSCRSISSYKFLRMAEAAAENEVRSTLDVKTITEGKAEVLFPKSVFYNPVQEFNRDLTIAVITQFAKEHFKKSKEREASKENLKTERNPDSSKKQEITSCNGSDQNKSLSVYIMPDSNVSSDQLSSKFDCSNETVLKEGVRYEEGIRVFEGLAASGLRSVRFGLEIPGLKEITANDFDKTAVDFIVQNIKKNRLDGLMKATCGDARMVMYQNQGFKDRFDVIDIDPYGSPAPFLDAAVQAVSDGGLLCVTCTDTAVLCGNAGETCYSKYGAMSLKGKFCHEMALRIILQTIESHANRYSRYIVPLLSVSADFYVRVFVSVYSGQGKVKQSVSKMAMVYCCTGCGSFSLQRLGEKTLTKVGNFKYTPGSGPPVSQMCSHCGFKHHLGGPIWAEALHNQEFLEKVLKGIESLLHLKTRDRIIGMLTVIMEELHDVPLYYVTDALCNTLHCSSLSLLQMRSALLNAGYRVSQSHAAQNSHKTDAPAEVIWDIMRAWVKRNPIKEHHLKPGTVVKGILEKESQHNISFELHPEANPPSRVKGLLRWQMNPEPEWGPKPRAKKTGPTDSQKNTKQGKHKQDQDCVNYKQYSCKRFKSGKCVLGDNCRYSHDDHTTESHS